MADQDVTRKLAAILSADMVGYSRLMEVDDGLDLGGDTYNRISAVGGADRLYGGLSARNGHAANTERPGDVWLGHSFANLRSLLSVFQVG